MAESSDKPKPSRDWNAFAAIFAVLIGALALLVSAYTAYVQRQQLRAQIWPFVVVETANVPPELSLRVNNTGTGPARIVAVAVTVDRIPVQSWGMAQRVIGLASGGVITSQLSGTVLSAGKELTILRPYNEKLFQAFADQFLSNKHVVDVAVCYCSVLDECWITGADGESMPIAGPDACPIVPVLRFKQ